MAIYHMQAKVVSRGSGRSAVAASAYMSCSRMYNDYDGIQHDYTRKHGLIYQEVMLPPMAPSEWNDREQLWNAVEETENITPAASPHKNLFFLNNFPAIIPPRIFTTIYVPVTTALIAFSS